MYYIYDETYRSIFLLPYTFSLRGESCMQAALLTLTLSSLNKLCVCIVRLALTIQKLKANIRKQIFTEATPPFFFVNIVAVLLLGIWSCRWRWGKGNSSITEFSFPNWFMEVILMGNCFFFYFLVQWNCINPLILSQSCPMEYRSPNTIQSQLNRSDVVYKTCTMSIEPRSPAPLAAVQPTELLLWTIINLAHGVS